MEKKRSIIENFIGFWGEVYDVNPASAVLLIIIFIPIIVISIPVDLIRVIVSKLSNK